MYSVHTHANTSSIIILKAECVSTPSSPHCPLLTLESLFMLSHSAVTCLCHFSGLDWIKLSHVVSVRFSWSHWLYVTRDTSVTINGFSLYGSMAKYATNSCTHTSTCLFHTQNIMPVNMEYMDDELIIECSHWLCCLWHKKHYIIYIAQNTMWFGIAKRTYTRENKRWVWFCIIWKKIHWSNLKIMPL